MKSSIINQIEKLKKECKKTFYAFEDTDRLVTNALKDKRSGILKSGESPEYLDKVLACLEDTHVRNEIVPRLRWAMFLAVYSYVEHLLNETCKACYRRDNGGSDQCKPTQHTLRDMRGRGVRKAIQYLSKVVGVKVPPFFQSEMLMMNELRNAFAHSNGQIDNQKADRLQRMQRQLTEDTGSWTRSLADFKMVECGNGAYSVQLSERFVKDFVGIVKVQFFHLFHEIITKIGESNVKKAKE